MHQTRTPISLIMTENKKLLLVLGALASFIVLPYLGGYIYFDGKFPDDFFSFPPLTAPEKAPFNKTIFIIIWITFFAVAALYITPRIYGFRKPPSQPKTPMPRVSLPTWFWVGFACWIIPLVVLVGHFKGPAIIVNWADIPMFWGFALLLDGIVYKRTGGKSIISQYPRVLLGIGAASISGWLIFEYLNFFVDDNWTYPKGNLIPEDEFMVYAIFGSSGLMPMVFEMHSFIETLPGMKDRYKYGPKVPLPRWVQALVVIACLLSLYFTNFFPNSLFFVLWFSPLLILGIVMSWIGVWTPFTPMKDGNWGPAMLFAVSFYFQGILHEGWNYLSGVHENGQMVETYNPDYWQYSIPFVNVWHVFEMPFLGLMGYLPFGIYCAVWWITFAWLLDIPTQFNLKPGSTEQS
jgi:hypothetical protein